MKFTVTLVLAIVSLSFTSRSQNALNFDGTDDYVQTTYSGISGNAPRTIEAWINTTANCDPNGGGTQQVIADWGTQVTGGRFTFNILWNNAIRIEVNGNGLSGSIPVNDGNWHHVAAVWDPASGMPAQLYVDGAMDVAGSLTVAVNTGTGVNMRIGRRIDDQKQFEGSIDELRVWSSAKSLVNLMATMNDELCTFPADLEAYYTFNQGVAGGTNTSETVLYDQSGNGNNGTLMSLALSGASSNWVNGVVLGNGFTSSYASETACDQYTWTANGQTYTSSGIYSTTLTNAAGCDSLASLDLTISAPNNLTTSLTQCDSYTWNVSGVTYTADAYIDTVLYNGAGCPYNHVLDLTITNSTSGTDVISACSPITWIDGVTYSSSTTTPTWVLTNGAGCDSTVTLDFTYNTVDNTTTNTDPTLSANAVGAQYQWVDCNDNYAIINGETNQSFAPVQNGSYAVIVTENGCTDTSACEMVATISLDELSILAEKEVVKITDLLGRETPYRPNAILIYVYSDGSIERRMKLEE